MRRPLAWVDGRFVGSDEPALSPADRGFTLGDGVFETIQAVGGRPVDLAAHLGRLVRSAEAVEIVLPPDFADRLGRPIRALLADQGLDTAGARASVRITVSRGPASSPGLLPQPAAPTVVIQAWPAPPVDTGLLAHGASLVASRVRHDPESPLAGVKTTSRMDHVLARLEAARAGADDAIFLTTDGYLAEATSANLFVLHGTELVTPALGCGILEGTVRAWTLRWARSVGLRPAESFVVSRSLLEADEAFLTSSVAGIVPATRFEGRSIGTGMPGPWTLRARADREAELLGGGEASGPNP